MRGREQRDVRCSVLGTYRFQVAVDDAVAVEVGEAQGGFVQLFLALDGWTAARFNQGAHQSKAIRVWVVCDVFNRISILHERTHNEGGLRHGARAIKLQHMRVP